MLSYSLRRVSIRVRIALAIGVTSAILLASRAVDLERHPMDILGYRPSLPKVMRPYWPGGASLWGDDIDEAGGALGSHLEPINILLIHVGNDAPPAFMAASIAQIRATNPISDNVWIWVIVENPSTVVPNLPIPSGDFLVDPYLQFVPPSELKNLTDIGNGVYLDAGFWRMTTERMFYIAALAEREKMSNVFLMESDNLLYAHLRGLLPVFKALYPGMGATKDNPNRGIAGLVWFSGHQSVTHFVDFVRKNVGEKLNDMQLVNRYFQAHKDDPSIASQLPVLPEYMALAAGSQLRATNGVAVHTPAEVMSYANNANNFSSVFDAAAVGQYLGGVDHPREKWTVGYVSDESLYQPNGWTFKWQLDTYAGVSSWIPYIVQNPDESEADWVLHQVNNLHIHHKNLAYHIAQPDGPLIKADGLPKAYTLANETQTGTWADRWNVQTSEFRLMLEQEPAIPSDRPPIPPNRPWSYPLISGDGFRLIADFGRDGETPEYWSNFDTTKMFPGCILMMKSDWLSTFFALLPRPQVHYILISHNADEGQTPDMIKHLESEPNLHAWFAQNPTFLHPRLFPIPIGFMNQQWVEGNLNRLLHAAQAAHGPVIPSPLLNPNVTPSRRADEAAHRDILLYVNFGGTNAARAKWIEAVRSWADSAEGVTAADILIVTGRTTFEEYASHVRRSRFVLSPPGHGLDCHRTWEALLLGAIPVVQSIPALNDLYKNHPILVVDGPEGVTRTSLGKFVPTSWTRRGIWSNEWYHRISEQRRECVKAAEST